MFEIFINQLAKNICDNQPNIFIEKLNKLMNNGSVLNRRESLDLSSLSNQIKDFNLTLRKPSVLQSIECSKKSINKTLKIPNILDCSYGGYEIVALLNKELEVSKIGSC